jgi:hypothetical protein
MFFEAAAAALCPVVPARIEYTAADNRPLDASTRDRVCWHGPQSFVPHFWSLLSFRSIDVEIRLGHPVAPELGRKALCRGAYAAVTDLGGAWVVYGLSRPRHRRAARRTRKGNPIRVTGNTLP